MGKKKKAKTMYQQKKPSFLEHVHRVKVKVIGIGGGGGNIVSEISSRVRRLDFVSANTDSQALRTLPTKVRSFVFGQELTDGLGCGMDADLGERAAKTEREKIKRLLEGSDVCILIATLGGGTGSGAAATFAEVAQELRVLCIGIFTMPFVFEGERRRQIAETALEKIKPLVQAYVIVPNEHIFRVIDQKTPFRDALSALNKRLAVTLEGLMETITLPGLINIDFADVRSILEGRARLAYVYSVESSGIMKASEAAQAVLANPLYDYTIEGTDRILFNVTGDRNLKMQEVARLSSAIAEYNPRARIIFGVACNARAKDRLKITLVAVGCNAHENKKSIQRIRVKRKKRKLGEEAKQKEEKNDKPPKEKERNEAGNQDDRKNSSRKRRNALEVKKAVDQEIKELEEKEKEWDIPAFLRTKP